MTVNRWHSRGGGSHTQKNVADYFEATIITKNKKTKCLSLCTVGWRERTVLPQFDLAWQVLFRRQCSAYFWRKGKIMGDCVLSEWRGRIVSTCLTARDE